MCICNVYFNMSSQYVDKTLHRFDLDLVLDLIYINEDETKPNNMLTKK